MLEVTIRVSDLYARAKEMLEDGKDYVTITLEEPDTDPDFEAPACITFSAFRKDSFGSTEYDELYHVSPSD